MNPIFRPKINLILRTLMRPLAGWIPLDYLPRVTGKIRVNTGNGRSFDLFCNPTSFQAKCLYFYGMDGWEPNAMRIFRKIAGNANLFLDVGANIGVYSLIAATDNPSLRILAFEPSPDAYLFLNRNIRANRLANVATHRIALSDRCGKTIFHLSIDPTFAELDHHLTPTGGFNERHSSHTPVVRKFEVRTKRLDRLIEETEPDRPVDLMKLDTESSEHLVLQGSEQVLSKHRPVILCEVLADTIEEELKQILDVFGYKAFRAQKEGLKFSPDLRGHRYEEKEHFFIPAEKVEDFRSLMTG